jgi:hypothetical protein
MTAACDITRLASWPHGDVMLPQVMCTTFAIQATSSLGSVLQPTQLWVLATDNKQLQGSPGNFAATAKDSQGPNDAGRVQGSAGKLAACMFSAGAVGWTRSVVTRLNGTSPTCLA